MDHKHDSKVILENSLRWANNILAEVLSNHAHRFPETRAKLAQAVSLIEEAKWSLFEESKNV
jgi:hypothetical protein